MRIRPLVFAALLLCALLGTTRPLYAQEALYQHLRPLASALDADGTLDPAPSTGALDARGYRLTTTATGAPRFVPEAMATAADGAWDDRFGLPGVSWSEITTLLVHDTDLYVAGFFSQAGEAPIASIARWDGHRWHKLGAGIDGTAHALAWYNGELYVGGSIDKAGAILANGIARWNGTEWNPVGDGLAALNGGPDVRALAVFNGSLYAGGVFNEASGVPAIGLARWDGTAWSAPGSVFRGPYDEPSEVYALAASGTRLYVGGAFDKIGGVEAAAIAVWNGTAWAPLGAGMEGEFVAKVNALHLAGEKLYAGGGFIKAGNVSARNVAVWNQASQTWSALGGGLKGDFDSGEVYAIQSSGADVYVGGSFDFAGSKAAVNIARWDGSGWNALVQDGSNGVVDFMPVQALAPSPGGVYLAGGFDHAGGIAVNRVARWDGSRFRTLGEGLQNSAGFGGTVYDVATSDDGKVYVVGQFSFAGGRLAENVAMWDGVDWHALGAGTDGIVHAVATHGTDVYIGGRFTSVDGIAASHIARWDAATETWHALGAGVNGDVWDLLPDGNALYVGGNFTSAGAVEAFDLARWDGAAWEKLGMGAVLQPGGIAYTLLLDGDMLWIGGDFQTIQVNGQSGQVNSLVAWNRATDSWFGTGGGVTRSTGSSDVWGRVFALAKLNGELYVGGQFDKVGGAVAASGVARFDGTSWNALGSGIGGELLLEVSALAVDRTDLYVGGRFAAAGTATSRAVARWNATTQAWASLEGGLSGEGLVYVHELAVMGGNLYVGGNFSSAGPAQAAAFAQWHITGTPPDASATLQLSAAEVTFSPVIEGQSGETTFTLTNISNAATLTGVVEGTTGPFSVVSGGGAFSLTPGQSRNVVLRFSPTTTGTVSGTLRITHNAGNTTSPTTVPLSGYGESATQAVTLRYFNPSESQYYVTIAGGSAAEGFVFGTNKYQDRAKGMAFTLPDGFASGTITQVKAWFAYRTASASGKTYDLKIYNGTAQSGPTGAPLYTKTYRIVDIVADDNLNTGSSATTFFLDGPVAVGTSFFVVFDFGDYTVAEAPLAGLASSNLVGERVEEAWEQWADGSWANVSDAWRGTDSQPGTGTQGWYPWISVDATVTTTTPTEVPGTPALTLLAPNAPNPFADQTALAFTLAEAGAVRLAVHDVLGREVAVLVDETMPAGPHRVLFEASDLPSGTYFYTLRAGTHVQTRPMTVVR